MQYYGSVIIIKPTDPFYGWNWATEWFVWVTVLGWVGNNSAGNGVEKRAVCRDLDRRTII